MRKSFAIVSATVLLAGCSQAPRDVKLTVVNESASPLSNVVAAGSGFSAPVGSIAPGAHVTVNPHPRDDAGFTLDFDADGRHVSEASPKDTWNGMKEVILTVSNDFSVSQQSVTTF